MKKNVLCLIALVVFGNLSFGQISFKELFNQYKVSSKPFFSELENFEKKINIEKNGTDGFKDEKTFSNWINENLSKTNYKNTDDAISDYKKLVNQSENLIKSNLDFFKEIENNNEEFLGLIYEIGIYEDPLNVSGIVPTYETNSPCNFGCINDAVECNRSADQNYAAGMAASGAGYFWNPVVAGAVALNAYINHRNAIRTCVRTFNNCIRGC